MSNIESSLSDTITGRKSESAWLQSALKHAADGQPQLIACDGAAGMGKTHLAFWFAEKVSSLGGQVLHVHCPETGESSSFFLWRQILRQLQSISSPVGQEETANADLMWLLDDLGSNDESHQAPLSKEGQWLTADSIAKIVLSAAEKRLFAIIIDDIHRVDSGSLLLLKKINTLLSKQRLLVLTTSRVGDSWTSLTTSANDNVQRLSLRPFGLAAIAELELEFKGADSSISNASVQASLLEQTAGIPLLLCDVLKRPAAHHAEPATSVPASASISHVVIARCIGLSVEVVHLLQIAAVLGRHFLPNELAAAASANLVDVLDKLVEASKNSLLVEPRSPDIVWSFEHDLFRQGIYDQIKIGERKSIHLKIANILNEAASQNSAEQQHRMVGHLLEAYPLVGIHRLVNTSLIAAELLLKAGDASQADDLINRLQVASAQESALTPDMEARLHLLAGQCKLQNGEYDAAMKNFECCWQALERAIQSSDKKISDINLPKMMANAALGIGALNDTGSANSALTSKLEQALNNLPENESGLRARLLARLAEANTFSTTRDQREKMVTEALMLVESEAVPALQADVINYSIYALHHPDNLNDRLELSSKLIDICQKNAVIDLLVQAHNGMSRHALESANERLASHHLAQHTDLSKRINLPFTNWVNAAAQAMKVLLTGDLNAAEKAVDAAFEMGQSTENMNAMLAYGGQLFSLRYEQGRLGEMGDYVELLKSIAPQLSISGAIALWVNAYDSQLNQQVISDELTAIADQAFNDIPRDKMWLSCLGLYSEAAWRCNNVAVAVELYELLKPYEERCAVVFNFIYRGSIAYSLGLLASVQQNWPKAYEHFKRATLIETRMGATPFRVRALLGAAYVAEKLGNTAEAAQHQSSAKTLTQQLDIPYLEKQLNELWQHPAEFHSASPNAAYIGNTSDVGAPPQRAIISRSGSVWTIASGPEKYNFSDSLGFGYLAELICTPGQARQALELANPSTTSGVSSTGKANALANNGSVNEVVDRQALKEYRQRLKDLDETLAEAELENDIQRHTEAATEKEFLLAELSSVSGLGGNSRTMVSAAERARQSVTKALKKTIKKISDVDPELGRSLSATIKTGAYCSFDPSAYPNINWVSE